MQIVTREIESWNGREMDYSLRITEDFGEAFRACTENATNQLNDIHGRIYAELEDVQEETQQLQMIVLHELRTFNILANYEEFYYYMSELGRTIDARFTSEIFPHLSSVISELQWASTHLPETLELCIWAIK